MSSITFYTPTGECVGELQHDESVQWLENYQSPGEVKIVARVTEQNLAMLVANMRLYNDESDTVAVISHRVIAEDEEGKETISVWADLTARKLDRRVVMATENISNVEAGMYALYANNRRNLNIEVGTAEGYTETLDTEATWGSVLEAEEKLAKDSGLGFAVKFDPETSIETLKVYRGVDRSVDGSPDYVGSFSTDSGDISQIEITSGNTDFKNVAIVAGAGEGANRKVRIVSIGNPASDERRELYVDARDLQREYQVATPTGTYDAQGNPEYNYTTRTYTEAEYNAILDARGYEKLAEQLEDFSIQCDIAQSNIAYGVDYFLGDRMPIDLSEYGIYATAVVASVLMVYESGSGKRVVVTLDNFKLEVAA